MKNWLFIPVLFFVFNCFGQITMEKTEDGILIKENNTKILFYQIDPKSKDGQYSRCNYLHPVWGVDGRILTEDFPDDHLHHRGIFWAWHQIWINGQRIGDPWEIKDFDQEVVEVEFVSNGMKQGILESEILWKSPKFLKAGKMNPYIRENTKIIIYPKQENFRRLDFEIQLLALEKSLSIGGSEDAKGYGGFSARINLPDDVTFNSENGVVKPETNAVEAGGFMNISGSLGENRENAGIVIISNSDNPGHPQPWILRDKKSMQNVVYPGRDPVALSMTKPLVLKYSLLIYKGKISDQKIKGIFMN